MMPIIEYSINFTIMNCGRNIIHGSNWIMYLVKINTRIMDIKRRVLPAAKMDYYEYVT